MSYATVAQLLTRFSADEIAARVDRSVPRLVSAELLSAAAAGSSLAAYTAEEQAAVAAVMTRIADALAEADSTIDGYVASRFSVPVSPAPAVIVRLACDIARYTLYDDGVTETIQKRYDGCVALLRDIAAGRVAIGDPAGQSLPTGGVAEMTSATPVWRRENSDGFI